MVHFVYDDIKIQHLLDFAVTLENTGTNVVFIMLKDQFDILGENTDLLWSG